ncbi:MAG: hypothetical protein BAJATHORv1_170003 [Candidatus Thorarchaeota archaeon]|nr:MAG: hypothetical protein BAJATHORv1_170003 [Candidatus Thorarchaeota archaeon]
MGRGDRRRRLRRGRDRRCRARQAAGGVERESGGEWRRWVRTF